jgi:hypothetical protein
MDGDDISICTIEETEKYESLRHREFAHTHVYDVNLLERVGLEKVLPTILQTVGWGKLMRTSILQLQSFLPLRYLALSHDHEHDN